MKLFTDYDHDKESHTVSGARAALEKLLPRIGGHDIRSMLDVGCGIGTWMEAAKELGVTDVYGLDGAHIGERFCYCKDRIEIIDLRGRVRLGKEFDLVICLEVAEHLEEEYAEALIDTLVAHSGKILFSAAVPGQPGQHHVNCRWPHYWQQKFHQRNYACSDWPRWEIWDEKSVEPHYRQNMIFAERWDKGRIGSHSYQIRSVIHPELMVSIAMSEALRAICNGSQPFFWYLTTPFVGSISKIARIISRCL